MTRQHFYIHGLESLEGDMDRNESKIQSRESSQWDHRQFLRGVPNLTKIVSHLLTARIGELPRYTSTQLNYSSSTWMILFQEYEGYQNSQESE